MLIFGILVGVEKQISGFTFGRIPFMNEVYPFVEFGLFQHLNRLT